MKSSGVVTMHNGDCIGSDLNAATIWWAMGGRVHGHPPENSSKRAFFKFDEVEAPLPYMERNTVIAQMGQFLVATPGESAEQLRSGTWSTIRRARKMGKRVLIVVPSGVIL
jgi:hypothetical protein